MMEARKRKLTLESHKGMRRKTSEKAIKQVIAGQFLRDINNLIPLFL